ncbi:hypothetical protein, partial [Bifidobacterium sp.]|uniref:hypothetical protein n=1 Tax=Bifidobacterium sp. TaxID=41200 RepID=UPI0038637572
HYTSVIYDDQLGRVSLPLPTVRAIIGRCRIHWTRRISFSGRAAADSSPCCLMPTAFEHAGLACRK